MTHRWCCSKVKWVAIRIVAIAVILVGAQLMWITALQGMGHGG